MATWRKGSWEALARGERGESRWPEYAEYARLRVKGLRREALEAADRCARSLTDADESTRWDFTTWLCTEVLVPGATRSMVLPHSVESVVSASLWDGHARGQPHAALWLVRWFPVEVMASLDYLTDAIGEFLRHSITDRPESSDLRSMLAEHLVDWVRADTADVVNGRYDGDPVADLARLAEAESLVPADSPILGDIAEQRQIVTEWLRLRH